MKKPCPSLVLLEEPSPVVNLFLHLIYNLLPWIECSAVTEDITRSVDALDKYGFPLHYLVQARSQLYNLILTHDLEVLAIEISAHSLSIDLSEFPDEMVEKMGQCT